jgi:hypothetical protein
MDLSPADFPQGFWICTKGVPLTGRFDSPSHALATRDHYDKHPAVVDNSLDVEAKFVKEEEKSFHIHLPRFLLYFIVGLIIDPMSVKGRVAFA